MIHCLLETKNNLIAQEIEQDIKYIIKERFDNVLTVFTYSAPNEICDWFIKFDDTHNFGITLKNEHQIDFIHQDNLWNDYARLIIEDMIAIKYGCRIKDEESPNQEIIPQPEKHTTFQQFLELTLIHHSPIWKKALIEIEMRMLPKTLQNF